MTKQKFGRGSDEGHPAAEARPATRTCKLCLQDVPLRDWESHLWWGHWMTQKVYDEYTPGRTSVPRVIDLAVVKSVPLPPSPPPPPPEPVIEVRLADVPDNPYSVGVEGRRSVSYNLSKGTWTAVRRSDFWIIIGNSKGGIPSKYPGLTFEWQEAGAGKPKKRAKK